MSQIEYRPYTAGDEQAILALFAVSFSGRTMTPDYWKWRFRDNPAGQILIELAWHREKLVAHYAVSPVRMSVGGEDTLCGLSVTTMTHPEYRGRGLFPILADRLYRRMAQMGYTMVWGFPNKNSRSGFTNKLGWSDICEIPMFAIDLKDMRCGRESFTGIEEPMDFDERFSDLWNSISGRHAIAVKRDLKYLQWRFGSHPENRYHLVCRIEDRGLLGYAVWKLYAERELEIVDLAAEDVESGGASLIKAVLSIGLRLQVERVRMWLPRHHAVHANLENIGFRETPPWIYLGARLLNSLPKDQDFFSESSWHYSMSDSDVF